MSVWDRVYASLPVAAQNAAVSLYGAYRHWLLLGGSYRDYVEEYRSRESFTHEQWRSWQAHTLGQVLSMCVESVPYYRESWNSEEKAAARAGDLSQLPLLDKQLVRESPERFCRTDVRPWLRVSFDTSGSTGTPIRTVWTLEEARRSRAVREARSNMWAGVSYGLPRATFSGRLVEPNPTSGGPFYRYNRVDRQVYFSAFHLGPSSAPCYVAALSHHDVQWLTGYAYSCYLLAKLALEQGLTVPRLRAVITTSEKLTLPMRSVIEEAFGCPVYEEYSAVENVLFASECEFGQLHVSPDVGVLEILRPDGTACAPGEVGEVAATGLMRTFQPLVRYRLGDVAAWDDEPCSCGRAMPVLKEVVGRIEDAVVGPDGRRVRRFHGLFVDQPHVREGQVIQEDASVIEVRVVVSDGFGERDAQEIAARVQQRLGTQVSVRVQVVDSIPRTQAGKFRAVVSLLDGQEAT